MKETEQLVMFQAPPKEQSENKKQRLLESIAKKLQEERGQLLQKMKPELIEFCLLLVEQLVRQELAKPEVLVKKIKSLLEGLVIGQEPLSILLAPEDVAMIESEKQRGSALFFCADLSLERGDIRIETPSFMINSTLKRELSTIRAHLTKNGEL